MCQIQKCAKCGSWSGALCNALSSLLNVPCDLQTSRRSHCHSLFKCKFLSRVVGQECCDSACVHVRSLHVETKQFAECSHVICRVRGGLFATLFSNASSYHVRLDKNAATPHVCTCGGCTLKPSSLRNVRMGNSRAYDMHDIYAAYVICHPINLEPN